MDSGSNCESTEQLSSTGSIGVNMHHSHSTPAGVDGGARTPPATPKKGGKMLAMRVQMLDDSITIFQVQAKALGSVLFEQVCKQLHLLEADYFGLEYADFGATKYWLDLQKPISRQLGLSLVDPMLYFCVKFYTPDPGQLEEEYTRYLFCLQIKRDLAQGIMQCNENTAALMASYIVQAECGDFVTEDYPDHTYLSSYKFVPQQDQEMERKIMENHKKHIGQSPAEADLNLLETARRCELYGMKMHPAKDHENVPLNLAVAHMGILVFQNYTKINTFSWAKIRKISFKRKRFLIKLHPEGYGYYKDTVEFFFEGRNECKNFWKKCVENHGFFRCSSVKHVSRHKTRVLSRGSSFRYSGKTQKQIVEFVRDNYVKRQAFQRSASFRHSSAHSSASNMHTSTVGNSISAHPLLPLADTNLSVEVSKLSASLGSMGVAVGPPGSPTTKLASRHQGKATCWSSAPDTLPTAQPARMMTSPSPPQTTQSASPVTSATTSPQHMPYEDQKQPYTSSLPVAVRAAVHRADTGTINIPTHITSTRMPSNHKSEGSLDHSPPFTNKYPSQTQSQNDLGLRPVSNQVETQTSPEYTYKSMTTLPKRQIWQRSASCRDLYDFSFEDSGEAKRRPKLIKAAERNNVSMEERKLESPITRYDDHRVVYSSTSRDNSLEIHQDIMMPDQKVYSSSYPGTTSYSQESMEDPGNYDLRDSQEDISHDSYELIERSDDEYSSGDYKRQKVKPLNARSCSLDSGNYLPSESDSDIDKRHKSKSSSDVQYDLFMLDDPRDFPREIIPRKSDGSYYKACKTTSRTSSLESKSDYYDTKTTRSRESLRKRGVGSRTSSQESRSDTEVKRSAQKIKSAENLSKKSDYIDSQTSSFESKSEYYDATSKIMHDEAKYINFHHDFDRKITFERNYGIQVLPKHDNFFSEINRNHLDYNGFPGMKETTHVHSISLQNVETEQSMRVSRSKLPNLEQNTIPRTQKSAHQPYKQSSVEKTTHIWPQSIPGLPTEIPDWTRPGPEKRSTDTESNIFSFDEDKIQSLQESSDMDNFSVVPNIDNAHLEKKKESFKTKFMEIETRCREPLPLHQPIERTKSDPNSLARQRINCSGRRLLLMHQKSIDLTPAESSDEDYLYKQIPPSAPPIMKYRGSQFEMPTAEFGHFDILKREIEGQKTTFEVPKSQFEVLGAKTQEDFINLPPKSEEISYVLHKRHIMNGTASVTETMTKTTVPEREEQQEVKSPLAETPKLKLAPTKEESQFLFTQNIDLSKVDPVTLEVDKSAPPVQLISSPKRDITHVDPVMLEALSSKLSQIESDSPTSSKTESINQKTERQKEKQTKIEVKQKVNQAVQIIDLEEKEKPKVDVKPKLKEKPKVEIKTKRIIKPRMQPGKKGKTTKTKVRITSFSSDDESLDSDDVFGSAEATPTRVEFSPPQTRKEMESILKFESERKYLQYTMSSTEVEGSPPTTRRKTDKKLDDLDVNVQPELRRISERSFSIPSSEDDLNIKTSDMQPVFGDAPEKTIDREKAGDTLKEDLIAAKRKEIPPIQEEYDFDKEREIEKLRLQEEIENDIRDLKVPPRTKITELTSPSFKKKGQLFAHARLNLSEGSAFTLLQKQQTSESPISGRRAISLDTPIIAVARLPPLNALSSKDDTVEETDTEANKYAITSGLSEESISEKTKAEELATCKEVFKTTEQPKVTAKETEIVQNAPAKKSPEKPEAEKPETVVIEEPKPELKPKKSIDKGDQIVPDVSAKTRKSKSTAQTKTHAQKTGKHRGAHLQRTKDSKPATKEKRTLKTIIKAAAPLPATEDSSATDKNPSDLRADSLDEQETPESKTSALRESQSISLTIPDSKEMKRTKSAEMEPTRPPMPKEKTRSLDKLEFKRMGSKERSRSQEESDSDIAKRKEKQQMLYETAIKQTKTIKSPVKDALPVFPQVEEMVRERHGKLEISINTIENTAVSLEEAIIITKSPKKLDKKIDKKLTKSLELNLSIEDDNTIYRMGKSLDLDNRPCTQKEEHTEFDFKQEIINNYQNEKEKSDQPPTMDQNNIAEDAAIKTETNDDGTPSESTLTPQKDHNGSQDNIVLEGTSLDVWLSVNQSKHEVEASSDDRLEDIKIIQKSNVFFDQRSAKPPDLGKTDTKSSSDSQSLGVEKVSLGNSLDIKYIDDSGDSSHKSDQDALLVAQMQKASATVSKFLRHKLSKRQRATDIGSIISENLVRITSEDETLVEVSELKCEDPSANLLSVEKDQRKTLTKTSIDRSRSEETASWVTVECDEYIGVEESFDSDNAALESPEKVSAYDEDEKTLQAAYDVKTELKVETMKMDEMTSPKEMKPVKLDLLKCSDQSKSSDTTGSWTSGEKELSPSNVKETDESSVSCSMGKAIGLSQTIEIFGSREANDRSPSESEPPKSPRSPRICVLGRAFTIDEESERIEGKEGLSEPSSDEAQDIPKDTDSTMRLKVSVSDERLNLHKKISRTMSSFGDKTDKSIIISSFEESNGKKINERDSIEKPSLRSIEKLSTDSKNSIDTESSSGSFGLAMRVQIPGDIPKELSSTWKPFPLDSSGSESFDEGLLPPDQDLDRQEYYIGQETIDSKYDMETGGITDDTDLPEDLANFSSNFAYSSVLTDIGGLTINLTTADVIPGYGASYLSRTLSRISERSTNSEKSSLDDDVTKASTQSDSLNDESLASSNPQVSLSSDPPSNAHFSENDKKSPPNGASTSVKNGKFSESSSGRVGRISESSSSKRDNNRRPSIEQIPNINNLLQRQISDDRRTSAEMAELSMDDIEIITSERGLKLKRQGSDDTIIDEECFESEYKEDKKGSSSQESDEWPLPEIPQQGQKLLLAMHDVPSSDTSQLTTQVFQPPRSNIPKVFGLRGSLKSQDSEQWPSPPSSVTEPPLTGNVETYYMNPPEVACREMVDSKSTNSNDNDSYSDSENKTLEDTEKTHTYENVPTEHRSDSISESLSIGASGVKIVLDTDNLYVHDSNSDEDLNLSNSNLNDDVFTDTVDTSKNELRPPTVLRRSTTSDDSSHSGKKSELLSPRRASHSSHSDEECTSSMTTHFEDGTVRYALKPTRCTHSSHSEDTSMALSLSEWSNSTNTVKFQNLSSNSGTTKSSSGLKSEDNSLTDIALSEWSSSNSNTLKAQQSSSLQFQKLSSTTSTGDSTLTELMPTISEWSSSESKTLVAQPLFSSSLSERQPMCRLGSSLDEGEIDLKSIPSPKNIPSEDLALLSTSSSTKSEVKPYTKSTERPIVIPVQTQSDTEKSSSSIEHKTVHTQRYDKEKQKYLQKHQISPSSEKSPKVPLKFSKCSPYYSSSLSSESTPLASTSPVPINKTATVPLTRTHRKPVSKSLFHAKSPPSENDSTSSVESPKSKSDRDRRGYRRRRQAQAQKKQKLEKEQHAVDEYFYVESETGGLTEYSEYLHHKNLEGLASSFAYESSLGETNGMQYIETLEEGYYPDVDSQSGSDIFRMEKDDDDRYEVAETFDVSSIPPPLLEDELEDTPPQP